MDAVPDEVVSVGLAVAQFRYDLSRLQHRTTTTKSGDASGKFDPGGAIAEALVLWSYPVRGIDWAWRAANGGKAVRDIGHFEVEAALLPNRRLILREYDLRAGVPPDTRYVLVQVGQNRGVWEARLAGWISLRRGLEHPNRIPMPGAPGVWMIDEGDLRAMPPEP